MGHNDERRQPRPRRKFSDEFKRDAVDLVLTTGPEFDSSGVRLGTDGLVPPANLQISFWRADLS